MHLRFLRYAAVAAAVLVVFAGATVSPAAAGKPPKRSTSGYVLTRASDPARTIASTADGTWVATFTDGASTVVVAGPDVTLTEPEVRAKVKSKLRVRILASPFQGTVNTAWLDAARMDTSADVLQQALQYVAGAPTAERDGLLWHSDASYGPLQADGTRQEGSDWNDYQGVTATYGDTIDKPEAAQYGSLDCSGFTRMLWGVRNPIPLSLNMTGTALPRRAWQQLESAPGVVVEKNQGSQLKQFGRLQPGDLVFFDANADDGTAIDHVGMYLGIDTLGHHRFVSSRKSIDGPTMGDYRGRSTLNGTGLYATAFRAVRRL